MVTHRFVCCHTPLGVAFLRASCAATIGARLLEGDFHPILRDVRHDDSAASVAPLALCVHAFLLTIGLQLDRILTPHSPRVNRNTGSL